MNLRRLLIALSKIGLLSISNVAKLYEAIMQHGINLMTLLQFAARNYGENIALIDDKEELTFNKLMKESLQLSIYLKNQYAVKPKIKVGIYCRNHTVLVKVIFALSRLGSNLYLINTEMGKAQFNQLMEKHQFDLFIYDEQFNDFIEGMGESKEAINVAEIRSMLSKATLNEPLLEKTSTSNIVLLTSGTTGSPKEVVHKPSLFNYLNPFIGMVDRLKIVNYKNGYIATPLYHGYGIAILFLLIALGKKVILSEKFHSKKACELIGKHQVEMVTVVPLMIHKMMIENSSSLRSLRCIASGGAVLSPNLIKQVRARLGDVLYNLYGTSETGLNIIATPDDLSYSPSTIGKCIKGINIKIVHSQQQPMGRERIGQLCVKSRGAMVNPHNHWLSTGDLGYMDNNGYYFLAGRQDDLVVSAGENVYPLHIENIVLDHPFVEDAAVLGIDDEQFGQRLHAFIQLKEGTNMEQAMLFDWLKEKVARYEMPKEITFLDNIPYTVLGKKDKKHISNFYITNNINHDTINIENERIL